jgi:hypothetical protein
LLLINWSRSRTSFFLWFSSMTIEVINVTQGLA